MRIKNEHDAHKALKNHRVVMTYDTARRKPAKLSAWQRLIRWLNQP